MKKLLLIIMTIVMAMILAPSVAFASLSEDGNSYVLEEDETWDSKNFTGDVYIPQDYTLITTGETVIEGDIYNFGTLNNKGNLSVSGTLNCLYYAMNGITMSAGDYDHGELISAGRLKVGTLNVKDNFLSVTIPAVHNHSYSSWITDKTATCTEEGERHKTCTACGDTIIETIPAAHTWNTKYTIDKAATCTKVGYKSIHCKNCDATTNVTEMAATGHTYKTQTKKATTTKNGYIKKVCSCGAVQSISKIYCPKTVKLSTSTYTYNGKARKPSVKVYNSAGKLISASNYTVKYAAGRKNVGKYKVTVTFKSTSKYYTGSKYTYLKINPKGTSISSVIKTSKAFTAKWKKQSSKMATSRITGYQIRYSTSSKMTNAKTVTIKGYSKTSKKVSKLKSQKIYYVQIRTYKTVSGTHYYSSWSKARTVKTK